MLELNMAIFGTFFVELSRTKIVSEKRLKNDGSECLVLVFWYFVPKSDMVEDGLIDMCCVSQIDALIEHLLPLYFSRH
jgi:hypothetical protein